MASTIEIINTGLIRLGANTINALDEGSVEATLANEVWENVRRSVLRTHYWNFALKEAELAALLNGGSHRFKYSYQLPADFIRLVQVYDDYDYKIYGREIHTNKATCTIKYIYDNTDPASWDASFQDVLAARVAAELAYPLTHSTSLAEAMMGSYAQKIQSAKFLDASEDIADPYAPADSPFISVRY